MNVLRSPRRLWPDSVAHGAAAAVVAGLCTVAFAVGVAAPAGAVVGRTGTGFGPHDPGLAPHASVRSHDVAPLTLANIVVTDLSTNQSTVYSTPQVTQNTGCLQNQTFVCLTLGGGTGGFTLTVSSPLQAGQVYSDVRGSATVGVDDASCGEFSNFGPASQFMVELDQYNPTPTNPLPYDTFAASFDCTNPTYDISGTIAYNIVPTDPGDGYYVFGQQGEITGFGNDNYLAYLDGAQYYNLNAPIVGMAPTPDGAGYWMSNTVGQVFKFGDAPYFGDLFRRGTGIALGISPTAPSVRTKTRTTIVDEPSASALNAMIAAEARARVGFG